MTGETATGANVARVNIYKSPGLFLTVAGLVAGSILIAATLERGPGLAAYLSWAFALIQGTPDSLKSVTLSPTGFPLLHHYLGTGLFLALPSMLGGGTVNLEQSAKLAGSIAILLTLVSFASLLYEIAKRRIGLVLLGISLLLVATNSGYYIRLLGAELFGLALVTLVTWLAWTPKTIGNLELAGLGALASLLMTVRPQSIIMASPGLALGLLRWARGRSSPQLALAFLYFGVPVAFGLLVVFQFNHWMTGEWTRSPYYFGNDHFKSVDLSARYIGLVLFDPKAGLLRYTPFIALGLCASLVHILDRRLDTAYRAFYIISLVTGLAHIWMIAGFYAWAGGAWIFGSRHLNLLSLYGVISVVHVLASEQIGPAFKFAVLGISITCAVYTATLLNLPYIPGAIIVGGIAVLVSLSKPLSHYTASNLVCGLFGLSLLFPLLWYYAWLAKNAWLAKVQLATILTAPVLVLACVAAVVLALAIYLLWTAFVMTSSIAAKSVALFSVLTLVIELILVANLRVGAAPFQARELESPSQQFLYINRFHVLNFEMDLQQESVYRWPEADKQVMKNFLEDEKRRTAIKR